MAAPNTPGPNNLTDPSVNPDADDALGNLLPQPVYQVLRNHFLKPHDTVHVSQYLFHEWLTRLGLQRWMLVLLLREALSNSSENVVRVTREELATYLDCSEKAVSDMLRHMPHPSRKGWRAIDPNGPDGEPDPEREALRLFIPRLRYWYEKRSNSEGPPIRRGFIIAASMDDPLTPEDEARMRALSLDQIGSILAGDTPSMQQAASEPEDLPEEKNRPSGPTPKRGNFLSGDSSKRQNTPSGRGPEKQNVPPGTSVKGRNNPSGSLKGGNDPITLTLTELTKYIQENIDRTLTSTLEVRRAIAPLVQLTEEALADFHSTGMFYKVLYALYPDHLDLFVQAVEEALEVGELDQHANLGAIFVESIKELARGAEVDLGFAGAGPEESGPDFEMDRGSESAESGKANGEALAEIDGWTADGVWQEALADLQLQMGRSTFETWLYGTRGVDWDGSRLVVELRNAQALDWVGKRMHPKIVRSVCSVVGYEVEVSYECRPASG